MVERKNFHTRNFKMIALGARRRNSLQNFVLAIVFVQSGALLLTLAASLTIALGAPPESFLMVDWLVPVLSLAAISFLFGRRGLKSGWSVALPNLVFYALIHVFITTRFLPQFWRDAFAQLTISHFAWWFGAIAVALGGAWVGEKWRSRAASGAVLVLAVALMPILQWSRPVDSDAARQSDGTTFRVRKFDLKAVDFGVYDADFSDSTPFDDLNATWLGQAMPRVWDIIAAREKMEPLCVVNGGFFGAKAPLLGFHEAPLKTRAGAFYDAAILENDWPDQNATLVWKRENNRLQPQILLAAKGSELQNYDGALGGVRVLIRDGKMASLQPGMGGATLKCSRTSVAWNRSGEFWILSVRDPDGEASSLRANALEKKSGRRDLQNGGWNIAQVQKFWQKRGASDAVLFDGGESSQIAFRDENRKWRWIHSSHHFSRTPAFWNRLPLRIVWPMLPPTVANGGVLNWFYVRRAA